MLLPGAKISLSDGLNYINIDIEIQGATTDLTSGEVEAIHDFFKDLYETKQSTTFTQTGAANVTMTPVVP